MQTCKECIHFSACEYWLSSVFAGIGYYHDLGFPFECSDDELLCEQYDPRSLPPVYIGMKVWVPWVFRRPMNEVYSELREGRVSGLQQKANGSWKIRVTRHGTVVDYTVEEFNKYCFITKEEAEKYIEEKVKELASE